MHLTHLTLNTGNLVVKHRRNHPDHVVAHLKKLLATLLPYSSNTGFRDAAIPGFEDYRIHIFSQCPETAFFHVTRGREELPFCYFAVALESGEHANALWRDLCAIALDKSEKDKVWLAEFAEGIRTPGPDEPEFNEPTKVWLAEFTRNLCVNDLDEPALNAWCIWLAEKLRAIELPRDFDRHIPQAPWLASYSCPTKGLLGYEDAPWLVGDFDCYIGFAFMALQRRNRFRQVIVQINQALDSFL